MRQLNCAITYSMVIKLTIKSTIQMMVISLYEESIYLELFKIMFPFLDEEIERISKMPAKPGQLIQELIDLLSKSVLTMDLSHIRGESIAQKDKKHLYNFLQLLFELSRLLIAQQQQQQQMDMEIDELDGNIKSTPISRNMSDKGGDYQRNHSVMGINQEFINEPDYGFVVYDQDQDMQQLKQDEKTQKNIKADRGSDASKSKESSQYDKKNKQNFKKQKDSGEKKIDKQIHKYPQMDSEMAQQLIQQMKQQGDAIYSEDEEENPEMEEPLHDKYGKQIHRSKSQRDLAEKKQDSSDKLDQIPNNKQNQMKAIENNIMPPTQKFHRIITTNPNAATTKQPQPNKQRESPQQEIIPEYPEDLSEVDMNFLENVDPEQIVKLPDDDPIVMKYQRELEKLQIFEEIQQKLLEAQGQNFNNQNIDDVIEAQIYNVKENLKNMRQNRLPMDEGDTTDQLIRKRNDYKNFLKNYLKEYNQSQQKLVNQKGRNTQNMGKKMKKIKKEEVDLKKQFENEHLSMYYKMRDEKLNYLRKIHRIIFELEKRKIIDEKKDHRQMRRQQNIATRNALTSIENAYNDRIKMLKDKLSSERQERHVSSVAQREILSKLERELKSEKLRQIDELKDVWRQEKEKFELQIKDDGQLEQKILQIYKKY